MSATFSAGQLRMAGLGQPGGSGLAMAQLSHRVRFGQGLVDVVEELVRFGHGEQRIGRHVGEKQYVFAGNPDRPLRPLQDIITQLFNLRTGIQQPVQAAVQAVNLADFRVTVRH